MVDTQIATHALYGGVVPEIASRRHMEAVVRVTEQALKDAEMDKHDVDAVAATCAPGLIGALLVGANFGKSLALCAATSRSFRCTTSADTSRRPIWRIRS